MKLISLELDNFRQHINTRIDFENGVTAIVGRNGTGKTTILEAVAWALYGSPAIRGKNDTVKSRASEGGAKIQVRLTFELGGQVYYIERELNGARLSIDGKPSRTGVTEVNNAIGKLLGMDYRAFFTSFFTEQKQLTFMAGMDGGQRAAAIGKMLGYDRLTKARDAVTEERRGLQREIDAMERGLGDPEAIKERKKDAKEAVAKAETELKAVEKDKAKSQTECDRLKPLRELSEQKAKRYEELNQRRELDVRDIDRVRKDIERLSKETADLLSKEKELDKLAPAVKRFEEAEEEYRKLQDLQKFESQKQQILGQINALTEDSDKLERRIYELASAEEEAKQAEKRILEREQLIKGLDQRIQSTRDQWMSDLKHLEATNANLRQRLSDISENRAKIETAGESGKCPTCERELGSELLKVLGNFDGETKELSAKLAEGDKKIKELQAEPLALRQMQLERQQAEANLKESRNEKELTNRRVVELNTCRKDLAIKREQVEKLKKELEKFPSGFDQARYDELKKIGRELKASNDLAKALRVEIQRLPEIKERLEEESKALKERETAVAAVDSALKELKFDPKEHEQVVKTYEQAGQKLQSASISVERKNGELKLAKSSLAQAEAEEEAYKKRDAELKDRRAKRLYLHTLEEAFERLRVELNDRIRPELEARTSSLVAEMTDSRYNTVELDEQYQAIIRDDGELKPIISGGEEDVLNLALRLAISEMITERAGQSFSLLILDEVFGSLDDNRRDNVVTLLSNLRNRFEQIILITHIESIHDVVDNCVWVEYDERTKTSRLKEAEMDQSLLV
jgi:exonuclease SbcC